MALPLKGVVVLELGSLVAVPFAGKLLAELGAEVIKIEAPTGDPARSVGPFPQGASEVDAGALFLWVNTSKRSVVLDVDVDAGRAELDALLQRSDVVLHDFLPARAKALRLDIDALREAHPHLIGACITPFGSDGPFVEMPATELTVHAISGQMGTTGSEGRPPLMGFGYQAEYVAGRFTAIALLALLEAKAETGRVDHVDMSWLEAIGACLEDRIAVFTSAGIIAPRMGNRLMNHGPLVEVYATTDGFVAIAPQAEHQWEGLCVAVDHPEWREDPRISTWAGRAESVDVFDELTAWFAALTRAEAMERLQALRVPSAPVLDCRGVLEDEQVRFRRLFETVDDPRTGPLPYALREFHAADLDLCVEPAPALGRDDAWRTSWIRATPPRPTPAQASITKARRPLEHIRVLDITQAYAGPFGGEIVAALGAEVIHVESHLRPDVARFIHPAPNGTGHVEDRASYFSQHNQGKLSLNLNLADQRGRELLLRLVPHVDVILNNFSARVMGNWGFTLDRLIALNPGIVLVGMPSFGATGPQSGWVCYGEALEAASGLVRARGYGPDEPIRSGVAYPDAIGGISAAHAILSGLAYRRRTGKGVSIDLSQRDGCVRLMGEAFLAFAMTGDEPGQWTNEHPDWVPHGAYLAAGDDCWLTVAVRTGEEWVRLCGVMGRDDLRERFAGADVRLASRDEVEGAVASWVRGQGAFEAESALLGAGVPAAAVRLAPDVIEAEPFAARAFHPEIDHPSMGKHRVHSVPFRFAGAGPVPVRRAPLFDEHSRELLRTLAGVSDDEYIALVAAEVTGHRPEVIDHM